MVNVGILGETTENKYPRRFTVNRKIVRGYFA